MKKAKIAIIGNGSISHVHMAAYKKLENVEIVANCDINEKRAKEYAERYGIPHTYTDYNEMLKREELDGVSVCTWNNVHAPASIAALNAGVNVLCEKPLAMNAEQAQEMVDTAKKNKKLLMVGFVRRFGMNTKVLKDRIEQGELGQIYYAKTGCIRRVGNPGGWFSDKKRSGGGPLIDLGVHMIDLVRYLMGKPKAVSVMGSTYSLVGPRSNIKGIYQYKSADYSDYNDVEDFAVGFVKFDNGATLVVENSWTQHIKKDYLYLEIYGSKAGATMEPELEIFSEKNDFLTDEKPVLEPAFVDFQHNFDKEIAHFVDCILNGTPCISPGEDGVELMKILDAIYKSAETGHEVMVG
ncbi:Predicted dehydrogenase [Caldanaerobius fijiensis DSM 17918]|uniref:Predicted dehydrogenase n=1 Tax=Caldanaerobius fijiensis DSM 17918 TaxID=1121256 RepID=A0A1M4TPQ2_9THEO|nr:Gfo/Idh/MocA family oxidoreductase [Caldanaerobius fijiensis]SHE46423.1 Predicted dehydrogenase [Caldanaerobius fijiensis DSM 17918]